jgi:hypothetical protein
MAVVCTCCSTSVDWWVRLRSHPDLPICHNCLAGLNGQRDGQLQLMTGSWLVRGFEPIFKVANLSDSVAWFERASSAVSFHDDSYAFAHRERDLTIHLAKAVEDERPGHAALYIHCQDADRVAEEWNKSGIDVDGPRDEDYGKREGSITVPTETRSTSGAPFAGEVRERCSSSCCSLEGSSVSLNRGSRTVKRSGGSVTALGRRSRSLWIGHRPGSVAVLERRAAIYTSPGPMVWAVGCIACGTDDRWTT